MQDQLCNASHEFVDAQDKLVGHPIKVQSKSAQSSSALMSPTIPKFIRFKNFPHPVSCAAWHPRVRLPAPPGCRRGNYRRLCERPPAGGARPGHAAAEEIPHESWQAVHARHWGDAERGRDRESGEDAACKGAQGEPIIAQERAWSTVELPC
jgi:hypothetical protein